MKTHTLLILPSTLLLCSSAWAGDGDPSTSHMTEAGTTPRHPNALELASLTPSTLS